TTRRLWNLPERGEISAEQILRSAHPDDVAAVRTAALAARVTGECHFVFRVRRPDGEARWIRVRGRTEKARGKDHVIGVTFDVTESKQTEDDLRRREREARLRARELKTLYRNAPIGLALLDRDLKVVRINEALARINGVSADDHIGRYVFDILPDLRPIAEPLLKRVLESGEPATDVEIEGERPQEPGVKRTWIEQFYPIKDDTGEVLGIGVVCEEVTDQRRTERARALLSRELSHRIKNMFAVISSIIRLSSRGNDAVQPFAQTIRGRIEALGRAHDYVRPLEDEQDASVRSGRTLQSLMRAILEPYWDGQRDERIRITGDDAVIGSTAATSLALAIHELATNAVKYGALSVADGLVDLVCCISGDTLEITWTERGGPPADEPPIREGFGAVLARRSVTSDLGGTLIYDWQQAGVVIRLSASLERLSR
ncbi:MAG TPA: PAS domain-containing protein, partial [Beijerinckiaceae bacterium]|nr:PAS domain-containing protein [Beijerinckiaceae bacterium]